MCTYSTEHVDIAGSAKAPGGEWRRLSHATVYFDHPVHALADHTVNIDLTDPTRGPSSRLAVELTASSARALAAAIDAALKGVPTDLTR